ncbi:MAG: CpXC domain-containing protein [Erysipelotrichaceae bacterium]|nr:CpXC domain-containing protein [Erysipelotrichaceae bacterium]
MSQSKTIKVTCPFCKKEHEFTVHPSLNVTLDPELKQKVLDRSLFSFTCPDCQKESPVFYPFLYHDMEKSVMIQFCAREQVEGYKKALQDSCEQAKDLAKVDMFKDYRYRIVTDLNDLNEKIYLFDAGLDDHVVELAKLSVRFQLKSQHNIEKLYYQKDRKDDLLLVQSEGKFIGTVPLTKELYEAYKTYYEERKDTEPFCIDENWAASLIMQEPEVPKA